jgi:hypothetical protein
MSMVMLCGSGAGVPANRECQIVAVLPSSTLPAGSAGAWSLATAVHPSLGKTAARSTDASAVGSIIGI